MPISVRSPEKPLMSPTTHRHVIFGHDLPKPRLTRMGLALCGLYLGLPVLIIGNLLDVLVQSLFGWCVGLWCLLAS
jgi:hypothetical protein